MNFAILFIFLAVIAASLVGLIILQMNKLKKQPPAQDAFPLLLELQREMNSMKGEMNTQWRDFSAQVSSQIQHNARFIQESHTGFSQTVHQVQDRLGQLQQATQLMVDIGRDISSLQDILKAPKLRGGLGELLLAELLRQILPEDHFSLQYAFSSGEIVDAVIILGQARIPVDAKFPLENFQRIITSGDEDSSRQAKKEFIKDVKKHIDSIASKYIRPEEGTYEFALMYIPAENVYYEIIIKDEMQQESISSYALNKKVIPVSPNSFYAYLQAIVRGLKGLRIERSAQMILESLGQLETEFSKCFIDFEKTGSHLSNAQSAYDKAMKRFDKLHDKLSAIEDIRKIQNPDLGAAVKQEKISGPGS